MAEIRVNPTRMELKRLQTRYQTARRGHKLLKDKRDELMRQFLAVVRDVRTLRVRVERALGEVYGGMAMAGAAAHPRMLQAALLVPKCESAVAVKYRNCMSVTVPQLSLQDTGEVAALGFPYDLAFTSGELDSALTALVAVRADLVRLAELEKQAQLLAAEIERTRRRVNALEHILMPRYLSAIRTVKMKLDENERGNITRLMKVKDLMLAAAHAPQDEDE